MRNNPFPVRMQELHAGPYNRTVYAQQYVQPIVTIILNGPPGVGKDTLFKALRAHAVRYHEDGLLGHYEFKQELYKETLKRFNLSDKYEHLFVDRHLKEEPNPHFGGMSPRQALQYVSEEVIKPKYGAEYFGMKAAAEVLKGGYPINVFTDGGFYEEMLPLERISRVLVVRLHRDGCTFKGDTRNYLHTKNSIDFGLYEGEVASAAADLANIIRQFVRAGEPK